MTTQNYLDNLMPTPEATVKSIRRQAEALKTKIETRTQHTPGPWHACDDDGTGTLPCVLADQCTAYGNFYVAQCNVYADARLIAAAPELLAALRDLAAASARIVEDDAKPTMIHMRELDRQRARACNAIAKAEGR